MLPADIEEATVYFRDGLEQMDAIGSGDYQFTNELLLFASQVRGDELSERDFHTLTNKGLSSDSTCASATLWVCMLCCCAVANTFAMFSDCSASASTSEVRSDLDLLRAIAVTRSAKMSLAYSMSLGLKAVSSSNGRREVLVRRGIIFGIRKCFALRGIPVPDFNIARKPRWTALADCRRQRKYYGSGLTQRSKQPFQP